MSLFSDYIKKHNLEYILNDKELTETSTEYDTSSTENTNDTNDTANTNDTKEIEIETREIDKEEQTA